MSETSKEAISHIFEQQKAFYKTQQTKQISFRIEKLKNLKSAIQKYEKEIAASLWQDLHKCYEEAFLTEIGIVYSEIDHHIKHLKRWAQPKRVISPIVLQPSQSKVISEPLGIALIVSPWNYPFQLLINPLIGAISAGNCAMVKPSPDAAKTAATIDKIISETFENEYITCIHGGRETNENLFQFPFDVVCFTGSSTVGKIFMKKFAPHLSKMILELGGKSPTIVDEGANLKISARRIIWGKTINAGQTCIAPDYVLVHEHIKNEFLMHLQAELKGMYGDDIQANKRYGRIITANAFARVSSYLNQGKIVFGGKTDEATKFIEPTVLEVNNLESDVMKTEIFGPILPIITYSEIEQAYEIIENRPKPLAFYYFGKSHKAHAVLQRITSGGACINDTLMHVANHKIPFGGVGNSGQGNYHGKFSFVAFSHQRSVLSTPSWIDLPLKYAPYKYFDWIKKLF